MLNVKEMFKLLKSVHEYMNTIEKLNNDNLFMKILSNDFEMNKLGTYRGIPVFEATEYMIVNGLVAAAIAISSEKLEDSYIVVDTLFLNLNKEEQSFLLAHEYGHYLNPPENYYGNDDRVALAATGLVHPEELMADKVAAENTGKDVAIRSLRRLKRMMKLLDFTAYARKLQPQRGAFPTEELSLRIAKIKKVAK